MVKAALFLIALFSTGLIFAMGESFCPPGQASFFNANNEKAWVNLCLNEVGDGHTHRIELTAFILAQGAETPQKLFLDQIFTLKNGEVVGPSNAEMRLLAENGQALPMRLDAEIKDLVLFFRGLITFIDENKSTLALPATMKLNINDMVWQKEYTKLGQEIHAIRTPNLAKTVRYLTLNALKLGFQNGVEAIRESGDLIEAGAYFVSETKRIAKKLEDENKVRE